MLRLRMFAVKKSMKRSLVRAPAAAIAVGRVSLPARTSAGGAGMAPSSVKSISSWGSLGINPPLSSPSPFSYHKEVMRDKEGGGPRILDAAGRSQF